MFKQGLLKTTPKTLPDSERTARPGFGVWGERIQLLTNAFPLTMSSSVTVHQYSVAVTRLPRGGAAGGGGGEEAEGDAEDAGTSGSTSGAQLGAKPRDAKKRPPVGRETAADAVRALAAAGGWADACVFDGAAAQLLSVRGDLAEESVVTAGAPPRQYRVALSKTSSLNPHEEVVKWSKAGGSPSSTTALAPVLTLLELLSKSQAAASDSSVRTPSGYLSYDTPVGRDLPAGQDLLMIGKLPLRLLEGFRSSVRALRGGMLLSVDYKVGAVLVDGPLVDVLLKVTGSKDVRDLERLKDKSQAAKVDVSGFEVKLSHTGARVKLKGLSSQSARDLRFKLQEPGKAEREVSVLSYYKERYGVTLKHPDLPCVLGSNKAAFPMELCTVVKAQRRAQAKDARDQAALIRALGKQAVVKPQERLTRLLTALRGPLGALQGGVAARFELGLRGAGQAGKKATDVGPLQVPGRLIPGPALEFKGAKTINTGNEGVWRPPAPGIKESGTWKSGAILVLAKETTQLNQGVQSFASALNSHLVRIDCPLPASAPTLFSGQVQESDVEEAMRRAVDAARRGCGSAPQLLVVVLPDRAGDEIRNEVKRVGHTVLGVATQCLDPFKAGITKPMDRNKVDQYCGNVLLKVNTKLGGTTAGLAGDWAPYLGKQHFMVIGADVSRSIVSSKGSTTAMTFAGVIGTQDRQALRTSSQMIAQIGKNDDLIYGMQEAADALIRGYAEANGGNLPEVIVMYRDGVSESFYEQVLVTEFKAIKQAGRGLNPEYDPKLTYVVVSKSHNLRLFPARGDGAHTHRSGNILPGTVVDDCITDNFAFEFFLNSHAGIIGTNRVPKYTVLVDQFGFTADSMQQFTHWLCHTYPLCHRSISVPPMVRDADKAAELARHVGGKEAAERLLAQQQQPGARDYELLTPLAMSGAQSMAYV